MLDNWFFVGGVAVLAAWSTEHTIKRFHLWLIFANIEARYEMETYKQCDNELEKWLCSRPYTYVGGCPYARCLIFRIIQSCIQLQTLGKIDMSEHIEYLFSRLDELPPRFDPPSAGHFFIELSPYCVRIVSLHFEEL